MPVEMSILRQARTESRNEVGADFPSLADPSPSQKVETTQDCSKIGPILQKNDVLLLKATWVLIKSWDAARQFLRSKLKHLPNFQTVIFLEQLQNRS
jgi:hypothetical protein